METPQTAQLLIDIEQRQDEVLGHLEELNGRLERALRDGQAQLKLALLAGEACTRSPADDLG